MTPSIAAIAETGKRRKKEQNDLRRLLDAEPDDQQDEIGELRQRPKELDERAEERLDPAVVAHRKAQQRAGDGTRGEARQHTPEAEPGMLPDRPAL